MHWHTFTIRFKAFPWIQTHHRLEKANEKVRWFVPSPVTWDTSLRCQTSNNFCCEYGRVFQLVSRWRARTRIRIRTLIRRSRCQIKIALKGYEGRSYSIAMKADVMLCYIMFIKLNCWLPIFDTNIYSVQQNSSTIKEVWCVVQCDIWWTLFLL